MQIKNTTLLAVIDKKNNRVLMIRKLKGMKNFSDNANGLGKDLYNLPGGKLLDGESFLGCAVRETVEETGITPIDPKLVGQLQFVFPDLTIVNQVFKTEEWSGEITCVGEECLTEWVGLDKIPYDNMWADDRTWFPEMMAGKFFHYKVLIGSESNVEMIPLPTEEVK